MKVSVSSRSASIFASSVGSFGLDLVAPFVRREDDEILAQFGFVVCGRDGDRRRSEMRWPRVTLPLCTPAISKGITWSPRSATIQRMGRMKRGPFLRRSSTSSWATECRGSRRAGSQREYPGSGGRASALAQFVVICRFSLTSVGSTPCFFANPAAACSPAVTRRTFDDLLLDPACVPGRRRPAPPAGAASRPRAASRPADPASASCFSAPGIIQCGISSVPISSRKSGSCAASCCSRPELRRSHRQIAHPLDHAHPLGDRNRSARVQQD